METVSVEVPLSSPSVASEPETSPPIRAENGTFLKGQSGNPSGRPLGSQNKAHLIKALIEDRLSLKLEKDALAIMQRAINMAKDGDRSMIKLLLGDMLASTRSADNLPKNTAVQVNVKIDNYTAKPPAPKAIDVTATEVLP